MDNGVQRKRVSFVFPVYNEETGLFRLYEELLPVKRDVEKKYDVEIVFVNDGSRDRSLERLIEIHGRDPDVAIVNLSRNFGHQVAVTAGLDHSTGDAVIVMDADLQDPLPVALELLKKWEEGFEVVHAQRRSRQDSAFKRATAHLFYRLLNRLTDVQIPKDTGDFRLVDRRVVSALGRMAERNRYLRGLVSFAGFRQTVLPFDRSARYAGQSGYSLSKMVRFAGDAVTGFSTSLLSGITYLGLAILAVGLIAGATALVRKLTGSSVPASLCWAALGAAGVGLQLSALGIVGLYVGRIYSEVQRRPLYIVESVRQKRTPAPPEQPAE